MANVSYIRVSTHEQNLDCQRRAMASLGIEKTFEEKASGTDDARPVLAECLNWCRENDTLFVTRIDRLARSTSHLLKIIEDLRAKGVQVHFVEQPELSTDSPHSKLLLSMLAAIATFETELRAARCAEGIAAAKVRGVRFGRPALDPGLSSRARELSDTGMAKADVGKALGIGRSSVYKLLSA